MQEKSWSKLVTIPAKGLQKSLPIMTEEQIDLNIIEIWYEGYHSQFGVTLQLGNYGMADRVHEKGRILFKGNLVITQYRYILPTIMNGIIKPEHVKKIKNACDAFDAQYVNGKVIQIKQQNNSHEKENPIFKNEKPQIKIAKNGIKKQKKVRFLQKRQNFIEYLVQISQQMFLIEQQQTKAELFSERIKQLNEILSEQNKLEQDSGDSESSEKDQLHKLSGYCFISQLTLQQVTHIQFSTSFPLKTKNRAPIVLDLCPVGRFLYKNDDQLAHEVIAMRLIRYLNKILGKQFAIQYEIIVQSKGAFYEFVEGSQTVSQIKKKHAGGLVAYFQEISQGCPNKKYDIAKRFAETYSGFCIAQYLLDIKDRNNGNIMVKRDGSIFHIDLAFIFEAGPGGISFESAPFKMTKQYINVMGGFDSDAFKLFETLMTQHFTKIHQCFEEFKDKIDILGKRTDQIRCFNGFKAQAWKRKLPLKKQKIKQLVQDLIDRSYDSWKTNKYDDYQFKNNGIFK